MSGHRSRFCRSRFSAVTTDISTLTSAWASAMPERPTAPRGIVERAHQGSPPGFTEGCDNRVLHLAESLMECRGPCGEINRDSHCCQIGATKLLHGAGFSVQFSIGTFSAWSTTRTSACPFFFSSLSPSWSRTASMRLIPNSGSGPFEANGPAARPPGSIKKESA
jgi:hypothetical protein